MQIGQIRRRLMRDGTRTLNAFVQAGRGDGWVAVRNLFGAMGRPIYVKRIGGIHEADR